MAFLRAGGGNLAAGGALRASAADSAKPAASRLYGACPKILSLQISRLVKNSGQSSKRVDGAEVDAGNLRTLVWMRKIAGNSPHQARCRFPIDVLSDSQNR